MKLMESTCRRMGYAAEKYSVAPMPPGNELPWFLDVLAVDDDLADLWLVTNALRSNPRVRRTISSNLPDEALQRLKEGSLFPSLIVVDLRMPKIDGFTFISDLRTSPNLKHIPTILLTTSRFGRDAEMARAMSIQNYVVKPDTSDELRTRLSDIIAQIGNIQ